MNKFDQIVVVRKLDDKHSPSVEEYVGSINRYAQLNEIPIFDSEEGYSISTPTLFVAVGGDGTMLHAMKVSLESDVALVLGLAAGHLGFLNDQYSDSQLWDLLDSARVGDRSGYSVDKRMAIVVNVDGWEHTAINEVTVMPQHSNEMFTYSVNVNGQHMSTQSGSGVIVATPTGSTAFSLSAGGAIVNPTANIMQVVPLAPHSLSSRPVVLSGDRDEVTICSEPSNRSSIVSIAVDGQSLFDYKAGTERKIVSVAKHPKTVRILRSSDWSFFETLSNKLKW